MKKIFYPLLFMLLSFSACTEDDSTLATLDVSDIVIENLEEEYSVRSYVGVNLKDVIKPTVQTAYAADDLTYTWYLFDATAVNIDYRDYLISTDKEPDYVVELPSGDYRVVLEVRAQSNDFAQYASVLLHTSTSYSQGFYILKETPDGNTDLDCYNEELLTDVIAVGTGAPMKGKPCNLSILYNGEYDDPGSNELAMDNFIHVTTESRDYKGFRSEDLTEVFNRDNLFFSGPMDDNEIHYGYIMDGEQTIDEVLVLLMRGPHSYTGEDTVEIDCHGGVFVTRKILETVIKYGARPAEPGEFSKRAFLNGRMDLSQAEAVIDIISSKNDYALQSSVNQLKGSVHNKIKEIREVILYHTAFIESALDDPEHISVDGYGDSLLGVVKDLQQKIQCLLDTADDGRIIKEGIKTVIVGKPNAGKSSLMNVLVGEEKAIVTEIAGTTRDVLEENIQLQGVSLNIMDTAGIRDTSDIVEKIGVDKAKENAEKADLIIYVVDASRPLDENDHEIIEMIRDKKAVILLNKSDLSTVVDKKALETLITKPMIDISAKEETGIHELESTLKEMFYHGDISFNDEVYITNIRHKTALADALSSLKKVEESIENQMPEDFFTIDLMDAYESLGSITGETIGEDLVNEIFSKFCMGK